MAIETMLLGAISVMASVITVMAGAVFALWRLQVTSNERCERERAECEAAQEELWKAIVELTGKCVVDGCSLRVATLPIEKKKKPPSSDSGQQSFKPSPTT